MDILRPQLIWIGNRCYRKNPLKDNKGFNPEDEELDDGDCQLDLTYCDEACGVDIDIEKTDRGYRYVMSVPNAYYKYIIGKKAETKRRLEAETRTQIVVPKPTDRQEEIVILGHDQKSIVSAKTRLDVIIDSARQRQQFTHFLSIPVTCEEVVVGFEDFKFEVLKDCDGDRGLDASLFQNPRKLHLTLGTMVLLNDTEIENAIQALQACQEEIIQPILRGERLDVQIRGLEYMNDDPGAVDVLYARVFEDCACDRLQSLADRLVDRLTSLGIMQQDHERVKLHVTVMNTLMRKDPSGTTVPTLDTATRPGVKQRESFDASRILKNYRDFNFGKLNVSNLQLSQRYSTGPDGYYAMTAAIPLPS